MMKKIKNRFVNETIESKTNEIMEKLKLNKGKSFDYVEENLYEIEVSEGETCEQCGGEMKEGKMCECGGAGMKYSMEEIEESIKVKSKKGQVRNQINESLDWFRKFNKYL